MLNKPSIKWMQQGLRYHKANDLQNAQQCYSKSLEAQQDNYETLQLLGALHYKSKNYSLAAEYLQKSLVITPTQAHVHNTLANVCLARGEIEKAIQHYKEAIAIKADYFDPYINLFKLFVERSDEASAEQLLVRARQYFAQHWRLFYFQAQLFRRKHHYQKSIECLQQAKAISQNNHLILHDLGLSYRLSGKSKLAIDAYKQVESLGHQSEAFYHNYANALSDISEGELALEYYSKALHINPCARETLLNWCDLMWESGKASFMFSAYDKALKTNDMPVEVYLDYIQKLLRVQYADIANSVLKQMQQHHVESVYCTIAEMNIKRSQRDYHFDDSKLDVVFSEPALEIGYKLDLIEYILEASHTEYAYAVLEQLRVENCDNQHLLALLQTCSRLMPTVNYPFNNIENYLFEYQVQAPKGQSINDYLARLRNYLLGLHQAKEQPLEQTLQHGTQTRGNLFDDEHPLLLHMQAQYMLAVQSYQACMAHLPPLYDGFWQKQEIAFSGSWSVALKQSGYHNNHFHPMGWLSSACYISLPKMSNDSNEGYFQIGIPNLNDGQKEGLGLDALKEVKPELGKLVLFPSCSWHGTVPFNDESIRLSIACDIVYATQ